MDRERRRSRGSHGRVARPIPRRRQEMIAGCTGSLRRGILYLTLDTRGSSVNVFTPAVALELERELAKGLANGARAVVLQSAKPGSFINGVGLLLAASLHAEGAAMERVHGVLRCYEVLA